MEFVNFSSRICALGLSDSHLKIYYFDVFISVCFHSVSNVTFITQARAITVPTDDSMVKARLRELGHPTCKC